ncbi:site-specific DNA-methyltransferase [Phycisphaerales bacterium AB-hyl4]|uniref:Methyltransferase n=1 Tax=Natronomicrosphaera hydrolytica TaxID=3242702 RepID=A0ABV4U991_9BACT
MSNAPRNTIAVGDCIEQMNAWPADSVDLVFADPPYNIGYQYDTYHDKREDDEYIAWTEQWIDACTRLLKPTGSMYILIGDEFAAETRIHLKKLQRDGQLLYRNWIIWHYTFGQRCKAKYNRSHAHLFYCVGSAAVGKNGKPRSDLAKSPPFTFHYDQAAVPSARMTTYKDARTNPKGKLPDDTWTLKFPASKDWHVRPQEAFEQSPENLFGPDGDTWYQSRLCGTFKEREQWHPCQLPEALLERIINVSSNPGDLVFDPFTGSGTTLAVAKRLGRDWLGCELSEDYATKAGQRLDLIDAGEPAAV